MANCLKCGGLIMDDGSGALKCKMCGREPPTEVPSICRSQFGKCSNEQAPDSVYCVIHRDKKRASNQAQTDKKKKGPLDVKGVIDEMFPKKRGRKKMTAGIKGAPPNPRPKPPTRPGGSVAMKVTDGKGLSAVTVRSVKKENKRMAKELRGDPIIALIDERILIAEKRVQDLKYARTALLEK